MVPITITIDPTVAESSCGIRGSANTLSICGGFLNFDKEEAEEVRWEEMLPAIDDDRLAAISLFLLGLENHGRFRLRKQLGTDDEHAEGRKGVSDSVDSRLVDTEEDLRPILEFNKSPRLDDDDDDDGDDAEICC
jgi:hypothetical protein